MTTPTSLRLFLAAPLTAAEQQALAAFRRQHSHFERASFRWLPEQNLHVTVFFLGAVTVDNSNALISALHSVCADTAPVTLNFAAFSVQPRRLPRMLWAQYQPHPQFTALVNRTGSACQPFRQEPAGPLKHIVIPHITLARMKPGPRPYELMQSITLPDFTLDHLELWQSTNSPQGTQYSGLASFRLRGQ